MREWLVLGALTIGVLVGGCTTTGQVGDLRAKSMAIEPGSSKHEVLALLGTPGDRSFNGKAEAWQYCSTGFARDHYMIVWFYDGVAESLTTYDRSDAIGVCTQTFSSVDWNTAPKELRVRLMIEGDG